MFHFRGADAEGQRAECAMGRGVRITADDGGAGQSEALFRADDMHHALAFVVHLEIGDAELGAVIFQRLHLNAAGFVFDALQAVFGGGHVVVGHGQGEFRVAHFAAGGAQALEGLRAGDFMHQVAVDIEQARAVVLLVHQMGGEDFIEEGLWFVGLCHVVCLQMERVRIQGN